MYHITISLLPQSNAQKPFANIVTGTGLQGLFFTILKIYNPALATYLHDYAQQIDPISRRQFPSPYTLAPSFKHKQFHSLQINLYQKEVAQNLLQAFEQCHNDRRTLHLGRIPLLISSVTYHPAKTFVQLHNLPPVKQITIYFATPTAFKQNNHHYLLPSPEKLFTPHSGPVRVWNHFAPPELRTPDAWVSWYRENVFISRHQIQTTAARLNVQAPFIGFIGTITLKAAKHAPPHQLSRWHALAQLAQYTGFGRKTSMGMGAVRVEVTRR